MFDFDFIVKRYCNAVKGVILGFLEAEEPEDEHSRSFYQPTFA